MRRISEVPVGTRVRVAGDPIVVDGRIVVVPAIAGFVVAIGGPSDSPDDRLGVWDGRRVILSHYVELVDDDGSDPVG